RNHSLDFRLGQLDFFRLLWIICRSRRERILLRAADLSLLTSAPTISCLLEQFFPSSIVLSGCAAASPMNVMNQTELTAPPPTRRGFLKQACAAILGTV